MTIQERRWVFLAAVVVMMIAVFIPRPAGAVIFGLGALLLFVTVGVRTWKSYSTARAVHRERRAGQ
jgi:membrane protein required for beta-lactamase induction